LILGSEKKMWYEKEARKNRSFAPNGWKAVGNQPGEYGSLTELPGFGIVRNWGRPERMAALLEGGSSQVSKRKGRQDKSESKRACRKHRLQVSSNYRRH